MQAPRETRSRAGRPPLALLMLAILYSVVPAMFKFVAMPLLWKYPLTEAKLAEIQAEIRVKQDSQ